MAESRPHELRALAIAVRELRARRMLKQQELNDAAGLGRNYVTTLENGRTNPRFGALARIAEGLDVPLSELVRLYEERLRD